MAHFLFAGKFHRSGAGFDGAATTIIPVDSGSSPAPGGMEAMTAGLEGIRAAAEKVAASHGLDVVDVELAGSAKDRTLRVLLEKNAEGRARLKAAETAMEGLAAAAGLPHDLAGGKLTVEQLSGITHEDCAAFSRDFGTLLDVEELVPGAAYTLEASSPGLDRKLTRPQDFERFTGCLVKVRTFEPVRNNRHWQGRLTACGANGITLDLTEGKPAAAGKPSNAVKKQRAGGNTVEIALGNIEKAQLAPEI